MIKEFFLKQMIKRQMKGVPEAQIEMIIALVEKNPEFFKKISDEIQAKVKSGRSEMTATMEVMRMHQAEMQKLMR